MKTVVISGAGAGIGLAIAKIFKDNDYIVYGIEKNENYIKNLESLGVNPIKCDVADYNKLKKELSNIDNIDVLVNNAAIQVENSFCATSVEEWDNVIKVNLNGYFYLSKIVIEKMACGQIINIGSVHSTLPRKNKVSYDVAKAGIKMLTKELALELAPNIRVNQIDIGATKTPMNSVFVSDKTVEEQAAKKTVLNVVFEPSDVANVVYELTTNTFRYMTGSIVTYDAGRSLQ